MARSPEVRYTAVARRIIIPVLLITAWLVAGHFRVIDRLFLPSSTDIWEAFRALAPLLPAAILTTLSMVILGFVIGVTFGTVSGLLMAYSPLIRDLLGSIFDFLRPVPVFALI